MRGLGLSAQEFWTASWREIHARRRVYDRAQDRELRIIAGIQAALHNGPLTRRDKKLWTGEMFMPDWREEPSKPAWQSQIEDMRRMAERSRKRTPEEMAAGAEAARIWTERMERAQTARRAGASDEEIRRIMEPVN